MCDSKIIPLHLSYHITSYHIISYHIISFYFPSVNPYRITQSIWIWKSSYLLGLRGDINTSVYNNHRVICYDKCNKIGQKLFSVIKYKDTNNNLK